MGTKRSRSGVQFNPKGATQGNTLVCPQTGNPIDSVIKDGVTRLAVDSTATIENASINVDLDFNDDSVEIGDSSTGFTLNINADGSIDTNIEVDAADGDNIAIHDSGGDELEVNADGSINVVVVSSISEEVVNTYSEVASVATLTPTTVTTYTAPVGKITFLQAVSVSGTNIAKYDVKINGTTLDRKYVYFGAGLSEMFDFTEVPGNGHKLAVGDVVTLVVEHARPNNGDFNARIQALEI